MTSTTVPPQSEDSLRLALKWSALGHFVLILTILVKGLIFPNSALTYIPTLKVDLVALPDVLKKDQKHPNLAKFNKEIAEILRKTKADIRTQKMADAEAKAAKKDEMSLNSKESKTEAKIDRKNLAALKRMKALALVQNSVDDNAAPSKPVKGNILSPGASLTGEAKEAAEANYLDLVRNRLQENWTLPTWIARQNLSSRVRLFIGAQGELQNYKVENPSTNPQFDDAVKKAVQESAPFPAPPEGIRSILLADGILVGFPL